MEDQLGPGHMSLRCQYMAPIVVSVILVIQMSPVPAEVLGGYAYGLGLLQLQCMCHQNNDQDREGPGFGTKAHI
ncbi:hypothetical protein MRX96_053882 [Rhipicephalus microplus]